jgi:phage terminase small subunit
MTHENDLRDRIAAAYDLETASPAWLALLDVAADTAHMIDQLEALVASDGLVAAGSTGQVRVHPAVAELRAQRQAYARLLAELGLDDRAEETFRQRQARYARGNRR